MNKLALKGLHRPWLGPVPHRMRCCYPPDVEETARLRCTDMRGNEPAALSYMVQQPG